jgi:hypothetical protein
VLDHIRPLKHHGPTTKENLAVACNFCNLRKGSDIAGIDPVSQKLCRLYHPRRDVWEQHFRLHASALLVGRGPVGRTTIDVLALNDPRQVALRRALINEGLILRPE